MTERATQRASKPVRLTATFCRMVTRPDRDPRQPSTLTFEQAAEVVIGLSMGTWKDPERIAGQWPGMLRAYAYPVRSAG